MSRLQPSRQADAGGGNFSVTLFGDYASRWWQASFKLLNVGYNTSKKHLINRLVQNHLLTQKQKTTKTWKHTTSDPFLAFIRNYFCWRSDNRQSNSCV